MKRMRITVFRKWLGEKETVGRLFINGKFFCYTLEDQIRPEGEKIYAETAIPYGCYNINITYSPKFGRDMILIEDVPMFSGIRIHTGNDRFDTAGCLLLGNDINQDKTRLIDSTGAYNKFWDLIRSELDKGTKIKICFVDSRTFALKVGLVGLAILTAFTGLILLINKFVTWPKR